ncbi:MAG: HlyD family efflux transporter periplasmic adaptor subunit [Lachnospiraceae bacterium]|nr:HlyD family efflux transporter periplasmic adaptor subunit [Lachnospiraceae bacterium]
MKYKSVIGKVFKHKKALIVGIVILLGASVAGTVISSNRKAQAEAMEAAMPAGIQVTKQDLKKTISISGTVASNESYSITSELTDVDIKEVKVKVGDRVKKGDVIALLDTTTVENSLEAAEQNLDAAKKKNEIEIAAAKRNYELAQQSAQANAVKVSEDAARAGADHVDALNKVQQLSGELSSASANLIAKDSAVANAKKDVEEIKKKVRKQEKKVTDIQNEVTKLQSDVTDKESKLSTAQSDLENANDSNRAEAQKKFDEAQDAYNKAKTAYDERNEDLEDAQDKQKKYQNELEDKQTAQSEAETAQSDAKSKEAEKQSDLKTAQDNVKSAKDTAIKANQTVDETARENKKTLADDSDSVKTSEISATTGTIESQQDVDKYKKQIEKATVKAPADGVITSVSVKAGQTYKGDEIAVLQDDSGYKVKASADQYDISDIAMGQKAELTTDTTGDLVMNGEVTFVSPVIATEVVDSKTDSKSASTSSGYPIEVTIKNPSDRLRIGMSVKLTIIEQEAKGVLAVPTNCIGDDGKGGSYVTVTGDDGTENQVPVKVGVKNDYYTQVSGDGISEGVEVVENSTEDAYSTEAGSDIE